MKRRHLASGTLLGFKIVPGTAITDETFSGQTEKSWSAIYVQLSVERAVSYLSNHFDRGHSSAALVALYAAKPLEAFLINDARIADGLTSENEKTNIAKEIIEANTGTKLGVPLMKCFGEALPDGFLLLPDDHQYQELVIPHRFFSVDRVRAVPLWRFDGDPQATWRVKACFQQDVPIPFPKDIREDFRTLAKEVHRFTSNNNVDWIHM